MFFWWERRAFCGRKSCLWQVLAKWPTSHWRRARKWSEAERSEPEGRESACESKPTTDSCGWAPHKKIKTPKGVFLVGAQGFEPQKSSDNRFTVCSIWPLWKAPIIKGINSLSYLLVMELANGIEPSTCWLQVSCSANWATPAFKPNRYYLIVWD